MALFMLATSSRLLAVYGLIALVALLFAPSTAQLARLWSDFDNLSYTHGFAIAGVSLWLIFRDRHALAAAAPQPSWRMFALWSVCAVVWIFFWHADIRDAYLVLFPALIWLALYAVLGQSIAMLLLFPIGYLYFTLPAWSWLNPLMQYLSIQGVALLLHLTGIPTAVNGSLVSVPAGVFEIAPACAGLHFLTVGLALAALLGELNRDPWRVRLKWMALMGLLAVLTNWIRIVFIIVSGQATQMQSSLITVGHYRFGWAVFAVALGLFLWIARRAERSVSL
jgi:exosortase